LIDSFRVTIK